MNLLNILILILIQAIRVNGMKSRQKLTPDQANRANKAKIQVILVNHYPKNNPLQICQQFLQWLIQKELTTIQIKK